MVMSMRMGQPTSRGAMLVACALACGAIAVPLGSPAAQDASVMVCASCDSASARSDRELARASAALERAHQAVYDAMRQAMSARDSSGAAAEALARANGELRRAQERYEQVTTQLLKRRMTLEGVKISINQLRGRISGGYLGVTLSTSTPEVQEEGGKTLMRFEDYPTIESVDPDSPAERAGLESGDKLLALNGRDVTAGCEPFSTLFKPGARVLLRVKRGAYTKQLSALIAKRPESSWGGQVWTIPGGSPVIVVPSTPMAPAPRPAPPAPPSDDTDTSDVQIMVTPFPSVSPMPDISTIVSRAGGALQVLAGAEVRPIGNLADYFGVSQGVLVLRVESGTVAARSGLQDGDVIVSADGNPVASPAGLTRAMYRASDSQLRLDIVRLKKKRTVLLKWGK